MAQISVDISKMKDRDSATAVDTLASLFETKTVVKITTKTTNYTATVADSGTSFNNNGASGSVNIFLPAATKGLTYCGVVATAQTFQFTAHDTNLIYSGAIVSSSGGNINSNTPYSYIQLECHLSGIWLVTFLTGTWHLA